MARFIIGFFIIISMAVQAETDCASAGVDDADSPNFAKKIIDCQKDPVVLWDAESKTSFLNKQGKVVKTYEAYEKPSGDESLLKEQIVVPTTGETVGRHYAGTTFLIREYFRMDSDVGPVAAVTVIAEMTKQMASYCIDGWEKEREWTERSGQGYYLHYQFTCTGEYQGK